jgi:hypothetical protein
VRRNGRRVVTVKTLHGSFQFAQQMYQVSGESRGYLEWSQGGVGNSVSRGLQELVGYYSNRLSYEELSLLVVRVSGAELLSHQGVWDIVQTNAQALSEQLVREYESTSAAQTLSKIPVSEQINLYDRQGEEILLMEDGILVKAQKANREKPETRARDVAISPNMMREKVNVLSDVVVLQTPSGRFDYLLPPIQADGSFRLSLEAMIRQRLNQHYGKRLTPLPIVVISDGARTIRQRLERLFGKTVCVILDWYHLGQKVRNLMSMIAQNKTEKATHATKMLQFLWAGDTTAAITYLETEVTVRNREKQQELLTYLTKHQSEIIDYQRRAQVGKSIGSGRMEKAVDQVIGHRQKHKGMSWRPQGSRALALLKVLELNGGWQKFWFPSTAQSSTNF